MLDEIALLHDARLRLSSSMNKTHNYSDTAKVKKLQVF